MRKLLFSTAMLSFFMHANAQITIDSTDYATVGDTIFMANDAIPLDTGISVGGSGAQTWDFTSLQIEGFDTIIFLDPGSTAFGSNFPSSNIAFEDGPITTYQTSSASQLIVDGIAGDPFGLGIQISASYNPAQTVMEYPSIYGSSFDDTSAFVEAIDVALLGIAIPDTSLDSIRMKHISYVYSEINAYGTVYLPSDSFAALRQYYEENTIDTLEWYCSNPIGCLFGLAPFGWSLLPVGLPGGPTENPILDTTYTYSWWAKGEDVPVVEIETDTVDGNVLSARFKIGNTVTTWITSKTDVSCNSDCNGQATVTGISGVAPYIYQWDDSLLQDSSTATGLCPGTYTVMVIDAVPDTAYATVVIGDPPVLTGTLGSTDESSAGANDGTVWVNTSGGIPPYTYLWMPGSLTDDTITGLSPDTFTVTVTDANGCIFTGTDTVFAGLTSVKELFNAGNSIKLYPNPTTGILNIEMPEVKDAAIFVYNLLGEVVVEIDKLSEFASINLVKLTEGTYFIKIQTTDQIITKKFAMVK